MYTMKINKMSYESFVYLILFLLVLYVCYMMLSPTKEGFQSYARPSGDLGGSNEFRASYAYPWWGRNNWGWNWWRGWYNGYRRSRCPSGCQWVGGSQEYGCPYGNYCYGSNCCKYDFECKGCRWGYDGPRGYGL